MCFYGSKHGDFILARNGTVLASKTKRAAAKTRPCGKRGSLCARHGVALGIISQELALRLAEDPEFVLPEPIKSLSRS